MVGFFPCYLHENYNTFVMEHGWICLNFFFNQLFSVKFHAELWECRLLDPALQVWKLLSCITVKNAFGHISHFKRDIKSYNLIITMR